MLSTSLTWTWGSKDPNMHLQFVGSGDAFGSGGRFNTCFHVVAGELNFLIDCGASSLVAMKRLGIDRNAIDLIVLTHYHAHHCGSAAYQRVVSAPDGGGLCGIVAVAEEVRGVAGRACATTSMALPQCRNPIRPGEPWAAAGVLSRLSDNDRRQG